jgi:hypothetical protein
MTACTQLYKHQDAPLTHPLCSHSSVESLSSGLQVCNVLITQSKLLPTLSVLKLYLAKPPQQLPVHYYQLL